MTPAARYVFYALILAFAVWLVAAARSHADPPIVGPQPAAGLGLAAGESGRSETIAALRGRVRQEHARYLQAHRRVRQLARTLRHRPSFVEAINLACAAYGSCDTLWRRAGCETGGTYSAAAYNRGSRASGLYQFLPSTWATTPFARFSIWSPYASALAAGWMEAHGRGGEWSCR